MTPEPRLPGPGRAAADLLKRCGRTGPPTDLRSVAALWPGVSIQEERIEGDGYLLDLGVQGAEVIVKRDALPARQRYTIAHELGHWLLLRSAPAAAAPPALLEKWCDRFAAALLMPEPWLQADLQAAPLQDLPTLVLQGPARYQVSREAYRIRVARLTRISVYELEQTEDAGRVTGAYPSVRVPRERLERLVPTLTTHLSGAPGMRQLRHTETGLLALPHLVHRASGGLRWLVCVVPEERG